MRDVEVPHWLTALPHAPEFRPTDTEFADPIAYISKIEKEASAFGICKIIPPLPRPSKKYVFSNLNRSLMKSPDFSPDPTAVVNDGEARAVFTTRQQELGHAEKKGKAAFQMGLNKQVWQSGELYTLDQFESKAKAFSKTTLGMLNDVSPLVVEALFWRAGSEKPIYVEYANDVPGSGFGDASPIASFQYFHKRRRRTVFQRTHGSSYKKYGDNVSDTHDIENVDNCGTSNLVDDIQTHLDSSSTLCEKYLSVPQQDKSDDITDMEGTAGWKLSNCPWNLQVIARSPGSLTRFMPDDIPGVTSPMVYIGMLFSWFAWHIEDHELHSLNFLHTGSSKTWYSVPGDYAFAFEEVIRTRAYGEDVDRLAALTMLGEKTTLLSPEVVVASGIPCCRLVQNPGEFVVTFPRAYHIGFSHGFNCGEAANFGTSHWLKVAKEAAVRRAAMNFLPMLSHQQLLYLLTMSFVTSVPRALLVGARSSRLRDRMKEERELSVKKAFIEDIVNENKLLLILCGEKLTYRAVLWDPESLPSLSKEPSPLSKSENTMATVGESCNSSLAQSHHNLLPEMSLYMETVKDHYVDNDDDFLTNFQVDYGTVACVACGILGFPFMTVVQPSEKASLDLRSSVQNKPAVQEGSCRDGSIDHSISALSVPALSLAMKFNKEWNTSNRFFRPRVFCLEHAIQVKELLESKGGAEVLVICHSDFQKIKSHAAAVAIELGTKYNYDMVPLDIASVEDLNLIDLAIDEDSEESAEDWSSILGINLRHCIKMRKNSSSKHVDHALKLFGLPENINPCSSLSHLKWQHTRSRSKTEILHESKQSLKPKLTGSRITEERKIILYKRRKSKPNSFGLELVRNTSENSAVFSSSIDKYGKSMTETGISVNLNESNGSTSLPGLIEGSQVTAKNHADTFLEWAVDGEVCAVNPTSERGNKDSPSLLQRVSGESEKYHLGTRVPLIEKCSEGIDVPCLEENLYSTWADKSRDKVIDAKPDCVISNGVRVGDDSSSEVTEIQSLVGVEDKEEPCYSNLVDFDQDVVAAEYTGVTKDLCDAANPFCSPIKTEGVENNENIKVLEIKPSSRKSRKGKRELEQLREEKYEIGDFIKSPCEGLRPRSKITSSSCESNANLSDAEEPAIVRKKLRHIPADTSTSKVTRIEKLKLKGWHRCELEACKLSFKTKSELLMHQQNQCHIQGCRKKFTCHRYLIVHQRVHVDDRPLKCSWKGCKMTFKWAWARTEHMRVHTGERPYICRSEGCGQSFRFISDFSRHRRKTGHISDQKEESIG